MLWVQVKLFWVQMNPFAPLSRRYWWQQLPSSHFGGQAGVGMNGNYTDKLSMVARDHYILKIQCIHGLVGGDKEHCHANLLALFL